MTLQEQWQQAKNILCVRLDAIGDVLMTTPAIRALKHADRTRNITLLTSQAGAEVASLIPDVDRVITYDPPWMKATAPRPNNQLELAMIEQLRSGQFDAAVIFTVFSQNPLPSALLCYLAEIPLRLAHCHENPYQLLTNWVLDPEPSSGIRHEVRRQLDLVASVGCRVADERLTISVPEDSYQRVVYLLHERFDISQPWVVIHPGASAASRRYPADRFAAVARRLVLDANCQVVFTGTESERSLVESIQTAMGTESHSLVGCLALAEMAALLAIAPLLIANNTGPAHIAAAVGTPVVDLYALTNPQHTPWGVPNRVLCHDVPCKFCYKSICPEGHHHCLSLVTPDAVFRAACELLDYSASEPIGLDVSGLDKSGLKESLFPLLAIASSPCDPNQQPEVSVQSAQAVWR